MWHCDLDGSVVDARRVPFDVTDVVSGSEPVCTTSSAVLLSSRWKIVE